MNTRWIGLAVAASAVAGLGCSNWGGWFGGNDEPRTFATVGEQVQFGATVFSNRCATCHGQSVEGTNRAPALVGSGALPRDPRPGAELRTMPFHNAQDVFDFASRNMPPNAASRASMTDRDYWAVVSYALSANGVRTSRPLGPENADAVRLHP
jgi:cytochrome c